MSSGVDHNAPDVLKFGLHGPTSDPIRSIETFYVRPRWLFVRVETEKGIVGWGEATLEGTWLKFAQSIRC